MVKKATERKPIKFLFLAIGQSSLSLFSYNFQMESNHYEMKQHFQTLSFSLDVR